MMKEKIKISVLVLFVILVINGCKKDDNSPNPYNGKTTAVFNTDRIYGKMTDQDSNVYKTITIGTQTWMAENLRTTKYRDGSAIPNITDKTAWGNLSTGAYCNYNNTESADTIATYGWLYNWYAATDSRNIAPAGWHIPTDAEWTTLTTYLGGDSVAGGKMKEIGTTHWITPNEGATNESGFTALPSGVRLGYIYGTFGSIGYYGIYMSSTFNNIYVQLRCPLVSYWDSHTFHWSGDKDEGFAVRLVKD
jgi:uncharacterized protein (TIGR02145 family)